MAKFVSTAVLLLTEIFRISCTSKLKNLKSFNCRYKNNMVAFPNVLITPELIKNLYFVNLEAIEEFSCTAASLTSIEDSFLSSFPLLSNIDLSGNHLTKFVLKKLQKENSVLSKSFEKVNLSNNFLTDLTLDKNKALVNNLDLSNNLLFDPVALSTLYPAAKTLSLQKNLIPYPTHLLNGLSPLGSLSLDTLIDSSVKQVDLRNNLVSQVTPELLKTMASGRLLFCPQDTRILCSSNISPALAMDTLLGAASSGAEFEALSQTLEKLALKALPENHFITNGLSKTELDNLSATLSAFYTSLDLGDHLDELRATAKGFSEPKAIESFYKDVKSLAGQVDISCLILFPPACGLITVALEDDLSSLKLTFYHPNLQEALLQLTPPKVRIESPLFSSKTLVLSEDLAETLSVKIQLDKAEGVSSQLAKFVQEYASLKLASSADKMFVLRRALKTFFFLDLFIETISGEDFDGLNDPLGYFLIYAPFVNVTVGSVALRKRLGKAQIELGTQEWTALNRDGNEGEEVYLKREGSWTTVLIIVAGVAVLSGLAWMAWIRRPKEKGRNAVNKFGPYDELNV